MGIASVVHLYVFPAKPYEMMGDVSLELSLFLETMYRLTVLWIQMEVRDRECPTKLRFPTPNIDVKSGMTIRESIVRDVKFTVTQEEKNAQ
ncbi:transmembrane protein 184 [Pyrus ussuriensis x Pyrus communis]|uniref:Transmembrane protein 184 n=1 Tax=Pyrus ussuriensis x Pyrus communis TaxID=2448454 RepID=A0A5N5HJK3_9ROSA|nr:transmembrane protein 184 [Pyrus ussuriensis x Pyrus communis]